MTYLVHFESSCDGNAFPPIKKKHTGIYFKELSEALPVSLSSCTLSGTALCLSRAAAIRLNQLQVYSFIV